MSLIPYMVELQKKNFAEVQQLVMSRHFASAL
jgi:hypothetical protein